jgi:hypothetical protein
MACKASTYPGALSKQEKCHQRDSWQMTEPKGETVEHFCDFRGAREARDAASCVARRRPGTSIVQYH